MQKAILILAATLAAFLSIGGVSDDAEICGRVVRISVESTWLNDRDQFLYPNNEWKANEGFQADCLVYTLFHSQNRVKSADGVNHWIPFTEKEVNAQGLFKSHFMSEFLAGKVGDEKTVRQGYLFAGATVAERKPIVFSDEAKAVMDAGRELWRYYHAQPNANPNASFYSGLEV